jgi:hypothetical protein
MLLIIHLPPISYMGKGFKEHECDFFIVGENLDKEITL